MLLRASMRAFTPFPSPRAPAIQPNFPYDIPTFATWGVDTLWYIGYTVGGSGTKWDNIPAK